MAELASKLTEDLKADTLPEAMWVKTGSTPLAHGVEETLPQSKVVTSTHPLMK